MPANVPGRAREEAPMTIDIERVDHIGIRVAELERALSFYQVLGFELFHDETTPPGAIVRRLQARTDQEGEPSLSSFLMK